MNPALVVALLAFAAYRLTRAVAVDVVGQPIREHIRNRWPTDPSRQAVHYSGGTWKAAKTSQRHKVHPKGPGLVIGCVFCLGAWLALGTLVVAQLLGLAVWPWRWDLIIFWAVAGGQALLSAVDAKLTA